MEHLKINYLWNSIKFLNKLYQKQRKTDELTAQFLTKICATNERTSKNKTTRKNNPNCQPKSQFQKLLQNLVLLIEANDFKNSVLLLKNCSRRDSKTQENSRLSSSLDT